MITRRSMIGLVVATFAFSVAPPTLAQTAAALKAVTSDAGAVRVVVKPKNVGGGAAWEFEVAMDTHIKPLDSDLAKSATLVDGGGRRYAADSWQGDPPGGHHRKGVLRFPTPETKTGTIEVQIENVGGAGKRTFRWTVQ